MALIEIDVNTPIEPERVRALESAYRRGSEHGALAAVELLERRKVQWPGLLYRWLARVHDGRIRVFWQGGARTPPPTEDR